MMVRQKKGNAVTGCLLPILGFVVFLVACYGFCMIMWLLGSPNVNTPVGGAIFWPFA